MYSLKRLTGAVLSRSSVRMATANTVPSPMASPPPQMSHSFGSLSGKETSYSQEVTDKPQKEFQKEKKTAKQAQKDSNDVHPYANREDPTVLRPDGSNSEEAVAADRCDTDPLEPSKHHSKKAAVKQPDNMASSTDRPGRPDKSPLRQVTDAEDMATGGPAAGP